MRKEDLENIDGFSRLFPRVDSMSWDPVWQCETIVSHGLAAIWPENIGPRDLNSIGKHLGMINCTSCQGVAHADIRND